MTIDLNLHKIETLIKKKDILKVFDLIKATRKNYPYNNKLNKLIDKYKNNLQSIFKIKPKEIIKIFHENEPNSATLKLEKLLLIEPNNPMLNVIIGNLYGMQGQFIKAKKFHEKGVLSNPFEDMFYLNLSQTLNKIGEYKRSLRMIMFAEIISPFNYAIKIETARAYYNVKELDKSFLAYDSLIKENANNTELKLEFCNKLINVKKTQKANKILKTIKENDGLEQKLILEGLILFYENKFDEAFKLFSNILKIEKNDCSLIYSYLALCCEAKSDYVKAETFHEKALKANPSNYSIIKNYGNYYYFIGKIDNAEQMYLKALNENSFDFQARYNLSLIQLYKNNFEDGWNNFKYRWLSSTFNSKEKNLELPYFKNQEDQNKILIWPESGIGDQILYSRFFKNISLQNKKIFSIVNPKLLDLFKESFPNIIFVKNLIKNDIHCHLPMGDLGKFYIKDIEDVKKNSFPYLKISNKQTDRIRKLLPLNKKICGISWISKNDEIGKNKSLSLDQLKKILLLPNYVFVDLQYGDTSKERKEFDLNHGVKVVKLDDIDNYNDIYGLASLIKCCDTVLSVSNSTAHLSGGIGKKTFLMLPRGKGSLWYWSKQREQSAWYKSVRIFEQRVANEWESVIDSIYKILS